MTVFANATAHPIQLVAYRPHGTILRGPWPTLAPGERTDLASAAFPEDAVIAAYPANARVPFRLGATHSFAFTAGSGFAPGHLGAGRPRRIDYAPALATTTLGESGVCTLIDAASGACFVPRDEVSTEEPRAAR
ncbi:MAG: hypothetical protein EP330_07900 [Deltaproteobacteria bacterium]|nr:MAG: hypothetical protein EP330_07900 [Deltaproteobacteria bacterium]